MSDLERTVADNESNNEPGVTHDVLLGFSSYKDDFGKVKRFLSASSV